MAGKGLPPVTPEEKRVNIIIAAAAFILAVGFAVYSWQVLPDAVAAQFKAFDTGVPKIPKLAAVLVPFGISAVSALGCINYRKQALVCLVGYAMNMLFWIAN